MDTYSIAIGVYTVCVLILVYAYLYSLLDDEDADTLIGPNMDDTVDILDMVNSEDEEDKKKK